MRYIALAFLLFFMSACAQPEKTAFTLPYLPNSELGQWATDCESPCRLPEYAKNGGRINDFVNASLILRDQGKALVIDTDVCISACTILLDELQNYGSPVCIAPYTYLGYHLGSVENDKGEFLRFWRHNYRMPLTNILASEENLPKDGSVTAVQAMTLADYMPICAAPVLKKEPSLPMGS